MAEGILEYVRSERRGFDELPPTDVDLLALSGLMYLELERVDTLARRRTASIGELFELADLRRLAAHDYYPLESFELVRAMVASPRFGPVLIERLECEVCEMPAMQFGAACFVLAEGLVAVAFRGTDETLVGWQEDLDALWQETTLGQTRALRYLLQAAAAYPDAQLAVCGHSKGGSLAEYAALLADDVLGGSISFAASFDGPALFRMGGAADPGLEAYDLALLERYEASSFPLVRYVTHAGMGLVMERREPAAIAAADGFSFVGAIDGSRAHSVFAFAVSDGAFVVERPDAAHIRKRLGLTRALARLAPAERAILGNFAIGACREAGIMMGVSSSDLAPMGRALALHYRNADPEERAAVRNALGAWKRL